MMHAPVEMPYNENEIRHSAKQFLSEKIPNLRKIATKENVDPSVANSISQFVANHLQGDNYLEADPKIFAQEQTRLVTQLDNEISKATTAETNFSNERTALNNQIRSETDPANKALLQQQLAEKERKRKEDEKTLNATKTAAVEAKKEIELIAGLRELYQEAHQLQALKSLEARTTPNKDDRTIKDLIDKEGKVRKLQPQEKEAIIHKALNITGVKRTISGANEVTYTADPNDDPSIAEANAYNAVSFAAADKLEAVELKYGSSAFQVQAGFKAAINHGLLASYDFMNSDRIVDFVNGDGGALSLLSLAAKKAFLTLLVRPYEDVIEGFKELKQQGKDIHDVNVVYSAFKEQNNSKAATYIECLEQAKIDSLFKEYKGNLSDLIADIKWNNLRALNNLSWDAIANRFSELNDQDVKTLLDAVGSNPPTNIFTELFKKVRDTVKPTPIDATQAQANRNALLNKIPKANCASLKLTSEQIKDINPAILESVAKQFNATTANKTISELALEIKNMHLRNPLLAAQYQKALTDIVDALTDEQTKNIDLSTLTQCIESLGQIRLERLLKDRPIDDAFVEWVNNLKDADLVKICDSLTSEQLKTLLQNSKLDKHQLNIIVNEYRDNAGNSVPITNEALCKRMADLNDQNLQKIFTAKGINNPVVGGQANINGFLQILNSQELRVLKLSSQQASIIDHQFLVANADKFSPETVTAIMDGANLTPQEMNQFVSKLRNDQLATTEQEGRESSLLRTKRLLTRANDIDPIVLGRAFANQKIDADVADEFRRLPLNTRAKVVACIPTDKSAQIFAQEDPNNPGTLLIPETDRAAILNAIEFNSSDNQQNKEARIEAVLIGLSSATINNLYNTPPGITNPEVYSYLTHKLQAHLANPAFQASMEALDKLNNQVIQSPNELHGLLNTLQAPGVNQPSVELLKDSFLITNSRHLAKADADVLFAANQDLVFRFLNNSQVNSEGQRVVSDNQKIEFFNKLSPVNQQQIFNDARLNNNAEFIERMFSRFSAETVNVLTDPQLAALFSKDTIDIEQKAELFNKLTPVTRQIAFLTDTTLITNNADRKALLAQAYVNLSAPAANSLATPQHRAIVVDLLQDNNLNIQRRIAFFNKLDPASQEAVLVDMVSNVNNANHSAFLKEVYPNLPPQVADNLATQNSASIANLLLDNSLDANQRAEFFHKLTSPPNSQNQPNVLTAMLTTNTNDTHVFLEKAFPDLNENMARFLYVSDPSAIVHLFNKNDLNMIDKLALFKKLSSNQQTQVLADPQLNDTFRQKAYQSSDHQTRADIFANLKPNQQEALFQKTLQDHSQNRQPAGPVPRWIKGAMDRQEMALIDEVQPMIDVMAQKDKSLNNVEQWTISNNNPNNNQPAQFAWDNQQVTFAPSPKVVQTTRFLATQKFHQLNKNSKDFETWTQNVSQDSNAFKQLHPKLQTAAFEKLKEADQWELFRRKDIDSETRLHLLMSPKLSSNAQPALLSTLDPTEMKKLVDQLYNDTANELHGNDEHNKQMVREKFKTVLEVIVSQTDGKAAVADAAKDKNHPLNKNSSLRQITSSVMKNLPQPEDEYSQGFKSSSFILGK